MKSRRHTNLAKIAPAPGRARNEEASIRRIFMGMGVVKQGLLGCVMAAGLVLGAVGAQAATTGLKPASPQPDPAQVEPGLAVSYYFQMFQDVAEVAGRSGGEPGQPLTQVNDTPQQGGPVLTSGKAMGVGAQIRGLIHFDKTGTYDLRVTSNDGVRLTLAGQKIFEDPGVHSDHTSPPLEIAIDEAGWYELAIDYFQKKGTATLQLKWTPPDGSEEPVPASAFAHRK
jgi:hypothetical protein